MSNYDNISKKLDEWIYNIEHEPDYHKNPQKWYEFRKAHDRDCFLADGDLKADTVISLWMSLRLTTLNLAGGYSLYNELGVISCQLQQHQST